MTASAPESALSRRVLTSRNTAWARMSAHWLRQTGVRPNAVSLAGIVFAVAASAAFYFAPDLTRVTRSALLLVAAACIQLRLLCNLLDGMLAIEGGLKSKTGELYNEIPDRIADVFILVGAGYSARSVAYGVSLGWAGAVLALFSAYVRVLGGSLGVTQHFSGPMAKQHRMFTLTLITVLAAAEAWLGMAPRVIGVGLFVIVAGSIVTVVRRTVRIGCELSAR